MPYLQLYVHLVWATWDRQPLLVGDVEARAHEILGRTCRDVRCVPLAIGGIDDHVHVLVGLAATVTIADLAQKLKGTSSRLLGQAMPGNRGFRWQGGYGAFTLRKTDLPILEAYVLRQKEHHAASDVHADWERSSDDTAPRAREGGRPNE